MEDRSDSMLVNSVNLLLREESRIAIKIRSERLSVHEQILCATIVDFYRDDFVTGKTDTIRHVTAILKNAILRPTSVRLCKVVSKRVQKTFRIALKWYATHHGCL